MLIPTINNTKTVTDLRENTIDVLNDLKKVGQVYILHRSDPKAVLLSIAQFEKLYELIEDSYDEKEAQKLSSEKRGEGISHQKIVKKYLKKSV